MDATLEVLRKDGDRRRNRKWHDVVKARIAAIAQPDMTLCSAHRELDRLMLEFLAKLSWRGEGLRTMKASKFTEAQKAFILKQKVEGSKRPVRTRGLNNSTAADHPRG